MLTGIYTWVLPKFQVLIALSFFGLLLCLVLIIGFLKKRKRHSPINLFHIQDELGTADWEEALRRLAISHKDVKRKKYSFLLSNFNRILYNKINRIRFSISKMSAGIITLIPSARWLFDNFQMVYREIKKIKAAGTDYLALPVLQTSIYRGYPRIYVLAKKMVDISGAYLDESNILEMVKVYQQELPLTGRELQTLIEMLELCLLERVIEVARAITLKTEIKYQAEKFVREKLANQPEKLDVQPLLVKFNDSCANDISFHCHVIYLLQNMSFSDEAILKYINFHCNQDGKYNHPSGIYKEEGKIESILESSIRTPIVSLREVSQLDEELIFEELSQIEQMFLQDPAAIYPTMNAESRGYYRSVIEKLSRKLNKPERCLGEICLKLAIKGHSDLKHSHHIGTYLVGRGYPLFLAKINNQPLPAVTRKKPIATSFAFFGLLFSLLAGFYVLLNWLMRNQGISGNFKTWVFLVFATPILLDIALLISNNILTRLVKVKHLPSMDYSDGVPDEARTIVVMPVISSSKDQSLQYIEKLHKHYLANLQDNLFFGVLLDYADADKAQLAEDETIKEALISRIDALNEQYPHTHPRFSLFIRKRLWNEAENCYMGWERKRGKLEEFNALLNGFQPEDTTFSTILCDQKLLTSFNYVITLDADSDLMKDSAVKLVGIIDHPLNRAIVDYNTRTITEGYAIIQPSIRNHILEKGSSLFPKIYKGQAGVGNYSLVTSDLYQDLFHEGTFFGKGIYNAKCFHQVLHKTVPENRVLSHDLLESCYAKTAFVSSINLLENFPGNYLSYAQREHRWIRGDWQLLPFLFKKQLSFLSRWKIADNLRASLVPLAKLIFVFLNIWYLPTHSYLWLGLFLFPTLFEIVIHCSKTLIHKLRRPKLAIVFSDFWNDLFLLIQRAFLDLAFIPAKAINALDAIIRTLYRVIISKKRLLKWNPADVAERTISNRFENYILGMWPAIGMAVLIPALIWLNQIRSSLVFLNLGLALCWALSPIIAFIISQSSKDKDFKLDKENEELLRDYARRIWRFFRRYSSKDYNWLCPDSFQITKKAKTIYKTSPTNIGFQLVSALTARDFGFESLSFLLDYTEQLLYAISFLPKWEGHLFNWYNTKELSVLAPQYISTVDSGNYLGNLIALKNGMAQQVFAPIVLKHTLLEISELAAQKKIAVTNRLKEPFYYKDLIDEFESLKRKIKQLEPGLLKEYSDLWELQRLIDYTQKDINFYDLSDYVINEAPSLNYLAKSGCLAAKEVIDRIDGIVTSVDNMIKEMNFRPLFNKKRSLFHIGYNYSAHQLDNSYYDLVASESIIASFLAIARGEIPTKHWNKLGRPLALINSLPAHVSWSGTMFEYLMPGLIMKSFPGSVFDDSFRAAVKQQIKYAKKKKIPWGISESQYFRFDLDSNYQYRAFGVPKLRLQPVYSDSLVVSPYSTLLALDYEPTKAIANLKRLTSLGMFGDYGFFEAIDFSAPDPDLLTPYCIVKSFMAHHQGMSLVALNNFINDGIMRKRFHAEPFVKAAETLLEEKRQSQYISISRKGYSVDIKDEELKEEASLLIRKVGSCSPFIPVLNYISNGKYSVLISSDGDGFSECNGLMLYKWRPDIYAHTGNYIYIKDVAKDKYWSASYHPSLVEPDEYLVNFSYHNSKFIRKDGDISSEMTVSISPDQNLEFRTINLKNLSNETKQIELTSYLELVLDDYLAELSHPAFNKLFLENDYLEDKAVLLARRRKGDRDSNPYMFHMVKADPELPVRLEYTNDRLGFIGRNNTLQNPEAVVESVSFPNSVAFTTDPIMSFRLIFDLGPQERQQFNFITGICNSKLEAARISDEFNVQYRIKDVLEKFRQQSIVEIKYLGVSGQQLNAFQDLISPLYYPNKHYRGPAEKIRRNWKNQSFLWRFGVSGNNPIMLLRISSTEDIRVLKDVLKAYEYLRINKLKVDLIIFNEAKYSYNQELSDLVNNITSSLKVYDEDKENPNLFLIPSFQLNPAEFDLLLTVARVVLTRETGIYFNNIKMQMRESVHAHP